MTRHRKGARVPTIEQTEERFDTGGRSFMDSLRLVLAGGRAEGHESKPDDEPDAGK